MEVGEAAVDAGVVERSYLREDELALDRMMTIADWLDVEEVVGGA